jgi:N-ethylmaleimide reductase
MSNQPLFTPYRMGDLDLPNRIVMAPLTRMRAHSHDHVPTVLQAEYYAQRASAGLIIAEATAISPEGFGWADTPGLWTKEQVRGWRRVTDPVHAAGGRIIPQLWHTGAISHPELLDGAQPVSASNVDPDQISVTRTGRKPTVTPRPLTKQEIQVTVADFARAARNAMESGFDGVQILANYLYLISQFLNATTNLRSDEYGGSLENRSRFLFEVVESVFGEVDAQRVGIKISPMHEGGAFQANDETLPVAEYAIEKLNSYNLSHLLLMGNTTDFSGTPLEKLADDGMFRHFRPIYKGTLIANVKMDRDRGIALSRKVWQIWWRSALLTSQIRTWFRGLPRMPLLPRWIGKPCMPRGRTAIPITQPTNHPNTSPGAEYAKDNTRTEQGDRSRSLRHSLQQTRLRGSRTLLVAEVHPAQRAGSAKDCSLWSARRQKRCATKTNSSSQKAITSSRMGVSLG